MDNFPSFRAHLACNVIVDCSGGRDEDECQHKRCNGVGFQVEDRCYILGSARDTPEVELNDECIKDGARLASLTTVREYEAVTRVMWTRQEFGIAVGLFSATGGLPSM